MDIHKQLEELGHQVLSMDNETMSREPLYKKLLTTKDYKKLADVRNSIMNRYCDKIKESDAILVCNYEKKGYAGYIGHNVLMEMGMALYDNKDIYLLNTPSPELSCYEEILGCKPKTINGDLSRLDTL